MGSDWDLTFASVGQRSSPYPSGPPRGRWGRAQCGRWAPRPASQSVTDPSGEVLRETKGALEELEGEGETGENGSSVERACGGEPGHLLYWDMDDLLDDLETTEQVLTIMCWEEGG